MIRFIIKGSVPLALKIKFILSLWFDWQFGNPASAHARQLMANHRPMQMAGL
jgi:hypothetical protein